MDDWPTERESMPRGGLRRLSNRLEQFENFCFMHYLTGLLDYYPQTGFVVK